MDADAVRGLNDAARTLVEQLDRHGIGNLALFEQQVAHLRGHLLSDDYLAAPAVTEPDGLDPMRVKDAVMRLPTHNHIFNDTPYVERLAVMDMVDDLARRLATPPAEPGDDDG